MSRFFSNKFFVRLYVFLTNDRLILEVLNIRDNDERLIVGAGVLDRPYNFYLTAKSRTFSTILILSSFVNCCL